MIIDFVEIAKSLDSKNKINLHHLTKKTDYHQSCTTVFNLAGVHRGIEIRYNANT